ncbi:MAG: FGGY-family carbohydrate kinase, partial [Actinomycetota bacterium]
TMGEISRCFYESLAMKFKYNFDVLRDFTKKDIEVIHLIGGGVNNKLLCQWIANVLNVPVLAGPSETTSVGNMIFQLKAEGLINNVSEGRKLCMNSFDIKSYEPKDIIYWSDKYSKYLKIARQKNT